MILRIVIFKKTKKSAGKDVEKRVLLHTVGRDVNQYSHIKNNMDMEIVLWCDPETPPLGMYPPCGDCFGNVFNSDL